mgnify:CR=1 FL=1|jgi:hypothetical protein
MLKPLEHECAKQILRMAMEKTTVQLSLNRFDPTEYNLYQQIIRQTKAIVSDSEVPIRINEDTFHMVTVIMDGTTQRDYATQMGLTQSRVSQSMRDFLNLLKMMQPRINKHWQVFAPLYKCHSTEHLRNLLKNHPLDYAILMDSLRIGLV